MNSTTCVAVPVTCYIIVTFVTFIPHGHLTRVARTFSFSHFLGGSNIKLALSLKQGHIFEMTRDLLKRSLEAHLLTPGIYSGQYSFFIQHCKMVISKQRFDSIMWKPSQEYTFPRILDLTNLGVHLALLRNILTLRNFFSSDHKKKILLSAWIIES